MRKEIATEVVTLMIDYMEKINDSVRLVQENCEVEEFRNYRKLSANILGEMVVLMNTIFKEHPDLKPEGLR